MANDFYNESGVPFQAAQGLSSAIRNEFIKVRQAFDKLPDVTGNAGLLIQVDPLGSGNLTAITEDDLRVRLAPLSRTNVTSGRVFNTTYPNLGTKPITVTATFKFTGPVTSADYIDIVCTSMTVASIHKTRTSGSETVTVTFPVMYGDDYRFNKVGSGSITLEKCIEVV